MASVCSLTLHRSDMSCVFALLSTFETLNFCFRDDLLMGICQAILAQSLDPFSKMSWSGLGVIGEIWRQGGDGEANGRVGSRVSDLGSDKMYIFSWIYSGDAGRSYRARQEKEPLSKRDWSGLSPQEMAGKNDTESWSQCKKCPNL